MSNLPTIKWPLSVVYRFILSYEHPNLLINFITKLSFRKQSWPMLTMHFKLYSFQFKMLFIFSFLQQILFFDLLMYIMHSRILSLQFQLLQTSQRMFKHELIHKSVCIMSSRISTYK